MPRCIAARVAIQAPKSAFGPERVRFWALSGPSQFGSVLPRSAKLRHSIEPRNSTPSPFRSMYSDGWPAEACTKVKPVKRSRLVFESIARSENPPHGGEAKDQEQRGHRQTDADAHVSDSVETPAEPADQVHNRIQ